MGLKEAVLPFVTAYTLFPSVKATTPSNEEYILTLSPSARVKPSASIGGTAKGHLVGEIDA